MNKVLFSFMLLILTVSIFSFKSIEKTAPPKLIEKVNWLTWEEAMQKSKIEKKKIFVDIYTEWCGWCKHMTKTTFNEPHIAKYLNDNFYSVKFDAEQKASISFQGKVYKYTTSGKKGYHSLAMFLAQGRLSYPTVIFMDEDLKVLQPISGYKNADSFERIMTYYGDNHFTETPWSSYQKKYVPLPKATMLSND